MKKIICLMLCIISVFGMAMPSMAANYQIGFAVEAQSIFMVNLDSNMVMYEQDKDQKVHPGYLSQLMTTIVALESGYDLDTTMIEMKSYTQDEIYLKNIEFGGVTLGGLIRGESLSLRKLLYAISVVGANEAALMVADYIGDGSADYFVEMMNLKAQAIGCTNTYFASPTGMPDEESYTTAYDMYLIGRYASELPELMEMANTTFYDGGPTEIHDNLYWTGACRMLSPSSPTYLSYLENIKTAYSKYEDIGSSAITIATKGGYRYMLVTLGSPVTDSTGTLLEDNIASKTTKDLYTWAFDTFSVKTLLEEGKNFGEIPLELSWDKDFIRLMAKDDFTALIPDAIDSSSITFNTFLPDYVNAPIAKGDAIGYVELLLAGERIGTVELVASDDAEANIILSTWAMMVKLTQTYWFKFILILFICSIISYVIYVVTSHNKRRRRYR